MPDVETMTESTAAGASPEGSFPMLAEGRRRPAAGGSPAPINRIAGPTVSTNAPPFDPLNASLEEEADMVAGYCDGYRGNPPREDASLAYAHGRRNGVTDKAGTSEPDQRALARRFLSR